MSETEWLADAIDFNASIMSQPFLSMDAR